jgi:hypothetical protein
MKVRRISRHTMRNHFNGYTEFVKREDRRRLRNRKQRRFAYYRRLWSWTTTA